MKKLRIFSTAIRGDSKRGPWFIRRGGMRAGRAPGGSPALLAAAVCLVLAWGGAAAEARQKEQSQAFRATQLASKPGLIRPSIFLGLGQVAELESRARRGSPYWERLSEWAP